MSHPVKRVLTLLLPILIGVLLGGCFSLESLLSRDSSEGSKGAAPQSNWVQVSSPHFDVAASSGEKVAQAIARDLEFFHALVFDVLDAPEADLAIPVRVHSFRKAQQIGGAVKPGPLAEFPPSMREFQFGIVGQFTGLGEIEFALHQYAHLLLYNDFEFDYPLWLKEGLAVYLATARRSGDFFELGGEPEGIRLTSINFEAFPIERLLRVKQYGELSPSEIKYFTFVSVALVRYLMTVNEQSGFGHPEFSAYRERLQKGESIEQAFEKVFGDNPQVVSEKLQELFETRSWPAKQISITGLLDSPGDFPAQPLSSAETHTRLASYTLSRFDLRSARWHAETALSLDPDNARAHIYLGAVFQSEQNWEEAEAHFKRALELDPTDALNHLDWAEYLHAQALIQIDDRSRSLGLDRAQAAYQKSLEIDQNHPEALAKLGEVMIDRGENLRQASALIEKAYTLHPGSWKIIQRLARARLALGRDAEARNLLLKASERLHKSWSDEELEEALHRLAIQ